MPTTEELEKALKETNDEVIRYALTVALSLRQAQGKERTYDGDAKERARQASAKYRANKKLKDALTAYQAEKQELRNRKNRTRKLNELEAPIDVRPKKKRRFKLGKHRWKTVPKLSLDHLPI